MASAELRRKRYLTGMKAPPLRNFGTLAGKSFQTVIILPRDSGEGGPPCASRVVEGAPDSTQRQRLKEISAATIIALQRQRRVESGAPSTTPSGWSPSPAIAGADFLRS